jgi:sugar/nucleoside kinase (ribokinase family)
MDQHSVFSVENPLVDIIARVDAAFLAAQGKRPGTMHLIDEAESAALIAALELPRGGAAAPRGGTAAFRTLPGGSAANTLRGVAWLNRQHTLPPPAFGGAVGRDALGEGYRSALATAGVEPVLVHTDARTGTSIILVTPDGERTMNTNLGACRRFRAGDLDLDRLARSRILYLTGYLWDTENQREAAEQAAAFARARGIPVAFDLADPWVVERYHERFREWVPRSVDLLFANGKELALLTGTSCDEDCMEAAKAVAPIVVMKVGARGCWVGGRDAPRTELVPTNAVKPLDTTGAGDSFAGGWLFGMLSGREPVACARLANAVARGIVGVYGCDYEAVGAPPA